MSRTVHVPPAKHYMYYELLQALYATHAKAILGMDAETVMASWQEVQDKASIIAKDCTTWYLFSSSL